MATRGLKIHSRTTGNRRCAFHPTGPRTLAHTPPDLKRIRALEPPPGPLDPRPDGPYDDPNVANSDLQSRLQALPKVELHRHLEGALRLSTLLELGRSQGLDLPLDSLESMTPHVTWQAGQPRSLAHFLTKFRADWYASYRDVERVAAEAVEDAASEGVVHLELRFSPEHFSRSSGLSPLGAMEAVVGAAGEAASAVGIGVRFLLTFTRERYDLPAWSRAVDLGVELSEAGVVGVDLAGDEFKHPNEAFSQIMARARDTGVLGVTIHAGEGTSPESVRTAIEQLGAQRIGHGISAAEDPEVMALLSERGVTLEVCPTSNYQTGCVDDLADHPLPGLERAGVAVTLNSDDPTMHGTRLVDDYQIAVEHWGADLQGLLRLEQTAVRAAFLDEATRGALAERIAAGYAASPGL